MAGLEKGKDSIKKLFIKYRNGNIEARDEIFSRYLPYVEKIVEEYRGLGLEDEDLTQSAYEGLLAAIESFNGDAGNPFTNPVKYNINKSILKALADNLGMNFYEGKKNIGLDNIRIIKEIKKL